MEWSRGFTASYFGTYVDPLTWQDTERFEITGGSISTMCNGLRMSANIDCVDFDLTSERWIRIYLDARQSDESLRIPMFTGLATSPNDSYNGELKTNTLQCYSPLKVAEDMLVRRGWFAPEETSGADMIEQLLSVVPAPVIISGVSPLLKQSIVAEDNETHLSMCDRILNALNWRITVRGDGTIELKPLTADVKEELSPTTSDIVEPQIETSEDWYSCPNVLVCYSNNESAEAIDETSERMSVEARGREIQAQETNCQLNADETLAEYAQRRLREKQYTDFIVKYSRRFIPDLVSSDVVRLRYPHQNVVGDFMIYTQSIELTHGAKVSEEVIRL